MKLPAGSLTKIIYAVAAIVVAVAIALAAYTCVGLLQKSTSKTPYFVTQSNTVLQVQTDGSIHASDQRAYQADGDLSHIVWNMGLESEDKIRMDIDAVRLSILDESGEIEQTFNLDKTAYEAEWAEDENIPAGATYGCNPSNSVIHIFPGEYAQKAPKQVLLTIDYTLDRAVAAYRDVAELEWVIVSGNNDAATKNVQLTVSLPAPAADTATDSIYAWSHGPQEGTLEVSDGGLVSYSADMVDVWQYASVRIDFPTSWLVSIPKEYASIHANELRLENAKTAEREWIDTWHGRTANSYQYDMFVIALFVLAALFALAIYLRHGKSRKPDFTDTYSNVDPAQQQLHPSVVGRIWRWNRKSADDLRAALVRLVSIGAVDVRDEGDASAGGKDQSAVAGYRLVKVSSVADALDDPLDQQTLKLLFDVVARKARDVRVQEIRSFKRDHAESYKAALDEWQQALDQQMAGNRYIEEAGKRWQVRLVALAVLVASLGLALFLLFGHPVVLASAVASAAVIVLAANYVPRRTVEGNNIAARSKALRNWLRDDLSLSGLKPGQNGGDPLYGLVPYASIFDTTTQALAKAAELCPNLDDCALEKMDDEDIHWRMCFVANELRKENQ